MSAGRWVAFFGCMFVGGAAVVAIIMLALGGGQSGSGASSANGLRSGPSLPSTSVQPLTKWHADPNISNLSQRVVRIDASCFVETISGGNGLDVSLAPIVCRH